MTRYTMVTDRNNTIGFAAQQDDQGDWVRYSDLAAARAEIERLTKERDELRAKLADAERDMRQRAADTAKEYYDNGYGHIIHDAILALPLKHAKGDS